jgi:hypothetical protein
VQTGCEDCEGPIWIKPDGKHTTPPDRTVAIVVDMQTLVGAVLIHRRGDDAYIGGVGTEDKGHTMLVPWNQDWDYYSIGKTSLAYMKRRPS